MRTLPVWDRKVAHLPDRGVLLFATDLAPDAFNGYLATNKKGRVSVAKLPARDDPMARRPLIALLYGPMVGFGTRNTESRRLFLIPALIPKPTGANLTIMAGITAGNCIWS